MKITTLLVGGIAAASLLTGASAFAQSDRYGPGGMRGMGMGMHGHMGPGMHDRDDMGPGMGGGRRGPGMHGGEMGRGMHGGMGPGMHGGMGPGRMGMMGMGMGHGSATTNEQADIHDMLTDHDRIKRTVTNLPNGIRTVTESDDPALAATIASHVADMTKRVEDGRDPKLPIQSPTLQLIFRNRDKIATTFEPTERGIVVVQTSTDPETVAALQKHAAEVNDLVKRGMAAAHENMMKNGGMMHGAGMMGRHRQ
jgi:hypothetical protein